jgi:hypothetical protein
MVIGLMQHFRQRHRNLSAYFRVLHWSEISRRQINRLWIFACLRGHFATSALKHGVLVDRAADRVRALGNELPMAGPASAALRSLLGWGAECRQNRN